MELNFKTALRAKEDAEKRFAVKDFVGAKRCALQAQNLNPELEGISQMVATLDVYIASEIGVSGEIDYFSILGLKPSANKNAVKKQYRKLAVLLHPDKNKSVGADGAFKLVSEAWTLLSDGSSATRRHGQVSSGLVKTSPSSLNTSGSGLMVSENCCNASISRGSPHTFWTLCTSCRVQYEYLRKYLNKKLRCKNCRGIFIAVETGSAPPHGAFPFSSWSQLHDIGYGTHGYGGAAYFPTNTVLFTGTGSSTFHSGQGPDGLPSLSCQWSSAPGAVHAIDDSMHKNNGKRTMKIANVSGVSNVSNGCNESSGSKGRPYKKRNGHEQVGSRTASEVRTPNVNGSVEIDFKIPDPCESATKCYSALPEFDARKLLIDKARTEIQKKLAEMRSEKKQAGNSMKCLSTANMGYSGQTVALKKTVPSSINVPDADFHDFDNDRSEICFKPKQIWALYDEEDGMPRLYCLVREVISFSPFRIHINYLSSKTDSKFGFSKSCGDFRAWSSDVIEQVNVFSHVLIGNKVGRGGHVQIYPRSGDVWALSWNGSPNWDRKTSDELRHEYKMVEILNDYSEKLGVCVAPLVKLDGFRTVFQRNEDKSSIQWISRREMLRFSHQVPSWLLDGEASNLPHGCFDLDPAAIPDELIRAATESVAEQNPFQIEERERFISSLF